jgi:hypothetical protein
LCAAFLVEEAAMTGSEVACTLREAAEALSALADIIESRIGGDDIDAVIAKAAMALQAALSETFLC